MTKDAVQEMQYAEPFKPFSLRLADGKTIPVPHPEFLAIAPTGSTVIVFGDGEKFSILDISLVTAIEFNSNGH
jgi:hypothetical protein